jgi:5-hydroxyisourate hydrolase-like protein (transthyretin family)
VDPHGTGAVKVRVWLAAGQPAAGWEVRAYRGAGVPDDADFVDYETTDQNGSVSFTLKAGTYTLVAIGGSNGNSQTQQTITVTAGHTASTSINTTTGMAAVQVWLAAGQPAAGWEVRAYRGAGVPDDAHFVDYETTDQNGSVSFTLKAGTYTLVAIGGSNGNSQTQQTITVTAGHTTTVTITSRK